MRNGLVSFGKGAVIHNAVDIIQLKEQEIAEGERVIEEMSKIEALSPTKLARTKGRVTFLRRFVALLKEGFIPIPRMEFEPVTQEYYGGRRGWVTNLVIDKLPVVAIASIAEFQGKFDRFGAVRPRSGRSRDPILIGIIRYGGLEEHFILAWWRPDLMKPTELW